MLWCSGAISSVCIPASYVLTLLLITSTTDVHGQIWYVVLTLVSLVCHCMWCTGMLHSLNYILVYTCLWCTWVVLWQLPVVVHWFTALHAPCVSLWWPVCLHWTWDTLCCPHTCMYTRSPVSFSCHSMDMWYMCGLYWTLLLGQVTHDRCCQCLLVLSGGPVLQWCWLGYCQGRNWRE